MKKILGILLALILTLSCAAALAEVTVDPELFPVTPTGKSIIQNPTTYCNPISITEGAGRVVTAGEPIIRVYKDDYYLTCRSQRGYWWSHDFVNWTWVSAPNMVTGIVGWVEIDGELYSYAGNGTSNVAKAIDIKKGEWEVVGTLSAYHNDGTDTGGYGDAAMLYDENRPSVYVLGLVSDPRYPLRGNRQDHLAGNRRAQGLPVGRSP